MEAGNSPQPGMSPQPQPGGSHRPVQSAIQPMSRRPSIDGFAPRRAHPGTAGVTPAQPHQMQQPRPVPAPQPMRPQPVQQAPVAMHPRPTQPTPAAPQAAHHIPVVNTPAPGHHPAMSPMHRAAGMAAPTVTGLQSQVQSQQSFGTQPASASTTPMPRPAAFGAGSPAGTSVTTPTPAAPTVTASTEEQSHVTPGHPREKNRTGHAGIVGFATFILLGALLLSPFIPGTIIQDFPFASNTYSTGDSSLSCIGTQGKITSTTSYDTKAGSPITYTYSTSTTQKATCGGQEQSATIGHTSQFNPLGLAVDILAAIVVAIVIARVWRMIFGEKKHHSHTPEL